MNLSQRVEPVEPPSRASVTASHRGFGIVATASRRVTGMLLVNVELSGGPHRIRRWFCVTSDEDDLVLACEGCIADLRTIIDELCTPRELL